MLSDCPRDCPGNPLFNKPGGFSGALGVTPKRAPHPGADGPSSSAALRPTPTKGPTGAKPRLTVDRCGQAPRGWRSFRRGASEDGRSPAVGVSPGWHNTVGRLPKATARGRVGLRSLVYAPSSGFLPWPARQAVFSRIPCPVPRHPPP